jgi:pimeloyl-ACP methyl ester carboxylesterase
MPSSQIEALTLEVDGVRARCLRANADGGTPTVYCHGNPTNSEEWLPFLEGAARRGCGPALAIDMPGWGRSARPDRGRFEYTMHSLSSFLHRCLDELGVGEHNLVVHDWGALALIGAQAEPERVRRLVLINAVPLLPGYRWHRVARIWRRRPLGEIANALTTRSSMALALREARGDRSAMPPEFVDLIWRHWDRGTRRAVLQLYRDADPDRLAAAGRDLDRLRCPASVLWGERDPYIPTRFGAAYADALPNAELQILPGVGHWPLVDDPSVVARILGFLD